MLETKDVLAAALKLAPSERARLLEAISTSLDGIDLGAEWEAEIERRVADVDAGRVRTVPAEEVSDRIRRRLGEA